MLGTTGSLHHAIPVSKQTLVLRWLFAGVCVAVAGFIILTVVTRPQNSTSLEKPITRSNPTGHVRPLGIYEAQVVVASNNAAYYCFHSAFIEGIIPELQVATENARAVVDQIIETLLINNTRSLKK